MTQKQKYIVLIFSKEASSSYGVHTLRMNCGREYLYTYAVIESYDNPHETYMHHYSDSQEIAYLLFDDVAPDNVLILSTRNQGQTNHPQNRAFNA